MPPLKHRPDEFINWEELFSAQWIHLDPMETHESVEVKRPHGRSNSLSCILHIGKISLTERFLCLTFPCISTPTASSNNNLWQCTWDKAFGGGSETCLQILIHSYHQQVESASPHLESRRVSVTISTMLTSKARLQRVIWPLHCSLGNLTLKPCATTSEPTFPAAAMPGDHRKMEKGAPRAPAVRVFLPRYWTQEWEDSQPSHLQTRTTWETLTDKCLAEPSPVLEPQEIIKLTGVWYH